MRALAIAGCNLRRLTRERSNIFFLFGLPMVLILLIGLSFGGGFTPVVGVALNDDGPLAAELVALLEEVEGIAVETFPDAAALQVAVERGRAQAGLAIPLGTGAALRAGSPVSLGYIARPDGLSPTLRSAVEGAVARQAGRLRAARLAAENGITFEQGLALARRIEPQIPPVVVETTTVGEALFPEDLGRFDLGAASQLVLFMFLTSLAGATRLIETRRLGISRRMLATPTAARTILLGEGLGRFGISLLQAAIIVGGSMVLFAVSWGDPLGALALVATFALVGTGASMLLGAALANDRQAAAIAVLLGLGLAALGGAMMPVELFSPVMQQVAQATPHQWAIAGFGELVRHGGTVADILPHLGVLTAYAAALLTVGTWLLRRTLTA